MMKKLLLPIAGAVVLAVATPSFATFWKSDRDNKSWNWPSQNEWQNDWFDNKDWSDRKDKRDWSWNDKDWDQDYCPPTDNPVPEPATAGLSVMGLASLALATRRRRK